MTCCVYQQVILVTLNKFSVAEEFSKTLPFLGKIKLFDGKVFIAPLVWGNGGLACEKHLSSAFTSRCRIFSMYAFRIFSCIFLSIQLSIFSPMVTELINIFSHEVAILIFSHLHSSWQQGAPEIMWTWFDYPKCSYSLSESGDFKGEGQGAWGFRIM